MPILYESLKAVSAPLQQGNIVSVLKTASEERLLVSLMRYREGPVAVWPLEIPFINEIKFFLFKKIKIKKSYPPVGFSVDSEVNN